MPEKPEVITVARKLKKRLCNQIIDHVDIFYPKIVSYPSVEEYKKNIKNQKIYDITTRGKWIVFELDTHYLLCHLRMEGKFFFRGINDEITKHEHVIFYLKSKEQLRFSDPRKFARTLLIEKEKIYTIPPFSELGKEPWDKSLTSDYLREKFAKKTISIKTALLDQKIITGIGNIYADEILFSSKINPLSECNVLNDKQLTDIIFYTREILDKAILEGGTTIRSYTSEEGVIGNFQNNLMVHGREKEKCYYCGNIIERIKISGRSTYFCPICQNAINEQKL